MLSVATHMDHTLAHVKLAIMAMEKDALVRFSFCSKESAKKFDATRISGHLRGKSIF